MTALDIFNGWVTGFRRVDGIPDKVYSEANAGEGIVCHSIEGDDRIDDIPDRFLSTAKLPNGQYTANAAASCVFINPLEDDHLNIQMYPVTASTWTSGNRAANTRLWPVEAEGFAGQPLTKMQRLRMWQIVTAWERHTGKRATRGDANGVGRNIWQHNEVWNWSPQNAGPTACPSGRYDAFFAELAERNRKLDAGEEIAVTREEYEALMARVSSLERSRYQLGQQVFGVEPAADGRFVGAKDPATGIEPKRPAYAPTNMYQMGATPAPGLPDHTHTPGGVSR